MNPICIVQARMGSTRLPGKVMLEVRGKPLIGYLLERLNVLDGPLGSLPGIVLTPDVKIADEAAIHAVAAWECPRNLEADVAGRFFEFLRGGRYDTFIRICADSPLLDPALLAAALALYEPPYLQINSPVGCVEVCDTAAFLSSLPFLDSHGREHVTTGLYTKERTIAVGAGLPRLVVDYRVDFERVQQVIERMDRPHVEYGWRECVALL